MKETAKFLEKLDWKTNQQKNHEYYVCEPHNKSEFERLVTYIKKHGYVVTLQGKAYACVHIGKYLYWTMWNSTEKADFINRMHI
jgi:hypothetical protein